MLVQQFKSVLLNSLVAMARIQCQPLKEGWQEWVYQPPLATTVHTILDNADRIQENAKCLDNIRCQHSETAL